METVARGVELRPVFGFPGYLVDECGNVFSLWRSDGNTRKRKLTDEPRPMRSRTNIHGYHEIQLYKDGTPKHVTIHRMVLEAFVCPRPKGRVAAHKDGNKANNHVSNLRWTTQRENLLDRIRHGTSPVPYNSIKYADRMREMRKSGMSYSSIASRIGCAYSSVYYAIGSEQRTPVNHRTPEEVRRLREAAHDMAELKRMAEEFGISYHSARAVALRRTYKKVEDAA